LFEEQAANHSKACRGKDEGLKEAEKINRDVIKKLTLAAKDEGAKGTNFEENENKYCLSFRPT